MAHEFYSDPAFRAKQSVKSRAAWADPETRERTVTGLRRGWTDPEKRANRMAAINREKLSAAVRRRMSDPVARAQATAAMTARMATPAARAQKSAEMTAKWADPEMRERWLVAFRNREVLGECVYCGVPAVTRDHIQPRTRGGSDEESNLALACTPCNSSKSNRTPEEWIAAERERFPALCEERDRVERLLTRWSAQGRDTE